MRKEMISYQRQQGFLSIIAVMLIVIIGFTGAAIAYLFYSSTQGSVNFRLANSALYLAESGIEEASRFLLTPLLSGTNQRIACSALTGNSNLTNASFSPGVYTVTAVTLPNFATTTLNGAITNSATTITLSSATNFSVNGRILIDKEAINYSAKSGNTLIGLTRGVNNTLASSHASGAYISQYQCALDSIGGVPTITTGLAKRELQINVQLPEMWAVGNTASNSFILTHWNRPTELQWTSASIVDATNNSNVEDISLLSNSEGWAVGDENLNNYTILHLINGAWSVTPISGACTGQNLNAVSVTSSKEAFAVGQRALTLLCTTGNYRYTMLYWNGSTWIELSSSTSPSIPADGNSSTIQNLSAVKAIDTSGNGLANLGFAVGAAGRILQYNGTQWIQVASPTATALNDVDIVSVSEAWAVGNNGILLKWNGSSWASFSSSTTTTLNRIVMHAAANGTADYGWAVGNNGVAIIYNGSTWSTQSPGGSNLLGLAIFKVNDVWAVGASGRVAHWDGTAWTNFTSNVSAQLNSVGLIAPGSFPSSGWKEIFS